MFRRRAYISISEFISGDKFPGICDYVSQYYDRIDELRFYRGRDRREPFIYYADTHYVNNLWAKLNPSLKYIVVSHNGDAAIVDENPRDCDVVASTMPDNVLAWFGQNVDTRHPKVHSLPIGLENGRWFPELSKNQNIYMGHTQGGRPTKLLYANCNTVTNPTEREAAYSACGDWATVRHGRNGMHFNLYLHEITDHFYVLSPQGNGIDCHRTWEALYLNRVPVMRRHRNAEFYEDLPVLLVDEWSDLTEDLLESKKDEFLRGDWNFDKLKFSYWRDKIHEAATQ